MNGAHEISAVGLSSQSRALEVLANNVANMNTPAFKRSEVVFSQLVSAPATGAVRPDMSSQATPSGLSMHTLVDLDRSGEIERTGESMDLAISGRGFVEVVDPNGETMLWRGGRLSLDASGFLSTADGALLRAGISVPADVASVSIDVNGVVRGRVEQRDVELGRISVALVLDPGAVEPRDNGLFLVVDPAAVRVSVVR
jgi:flagellar basal-body rod protein FlgG